MIADRWGVVDAEVAAHYGCDDLVLDPVLEAWRGVTVAAPADVVWTWVGQVRAAPYSYDWVDNRGHRSPRTVLGLAAPEVGESFTSSGGRPLGRVLAVEPGRELTGTVMGGVLTYRVTEVGPRETRLVLKVVMERGRLLAPLVSVGDLVMARRQLLTFKELAEASADAGR
ncbi:SRPBCC family protein [Oryzobacter telluris]|uniref:SRPBCC family protein n=1 Tax=Oryzobacter telluris TaxID=3149179 RepID=UPI00370DB3A2